MGIVAAFDKVLFFNAASKYTILRMKTADIMIPQEARIEAEYLVGLYPAKGTAVQRGMGVADKGKRTVDGVAGLQIGVIKGCLQQVTVIEMAVGKGGAVEVRFADQRRVEVRTVNAGSEEGCVPDTAYRKLAILQGRAAEIRAIGHTVHCHMVKERLAEEVGWEPVFNTGVVVLLPDDLQTAAAEIMGLQRRRGIAALCIGQLQQLLLM